MVKDMDKLEEYMRAHAAEFDTEAPPEGHERRFLEKVDFSTALEMTEEALEMTERPFERLRALFGMNRMRWSWAAVALAAAVVAVVLLPAGGRRSFVGVGNDPRKVYLAYLDEVERASRALPAGDDYNWEGILRGMTEEAVPMIEQLPEELSEREQARILKEYYGGILAGVEQLKKAK